MSVARVPADPLAALDNVLDGGTVDELRARRVPIEQVVGDRALWSGP